MSALDDLESTLRAMRDRTQEFKAFEGALAELNGTLVALLQRVAEPPAQQPAMNADAIAQAIAKALKTLPAPVVNMPAAQQGTGQLIVDLEREDARGSHRVKRMVITKN